MKQGPIRPIRRGFQNGASLLKMRTGVLSPFAHEVPDAWIATLAVGNRKRLLGRSYSTCLALEADGCWLLIDCPHPMLKMMREAAATAGA